MNETKKCGIKEIDSREWRFYYGQIFLWRGKLR
jgi:hypothetical protein